jgi:tetratricopeptide (TPR) repeat protein
MFLQENSIKNFQANNFNLFMKRYIITTISFLLCTSLLVNAQDVNILLKEASNFEKQLKEPEALEKYKQVIATDPKNILALVKCTEFNCSMGARQTDKNAKTNFYNEAQSFAQKALAADSNSADANYAMALVAGKMAETDQEKKQLVEYVRQIKIYSDKALAINPNHARANYVEGKWHYEMVTLPFFKKAAVKTLYGGMQKGSIDSAIFYMERCRKLDQYFVRNYLDLAKAYQYNNQPTNTLEVLNKLVKLPNRTADDAALKQEGQKLLDQMM